MLGGVAFGGAAAQLQTAIGEPSGENADVANALLGVSFSLAIFVAGVLGAVLISGDNGLALPIVMIALAIIAFSVVAGAAFSLRLTGTFVDFRDGARTVDTRGCRALAGLRR